jgi:proline utilization trans-activator
MAAESAEAPPQEHRQEDTAAARIHPPEHGPHLDVTQDDRASFASEHETERPARTEGTSSTHGRRIINSFAIGKSYYVSDRQGKAVYLGTSSTWSFGRRVMLLAQERIVNLPLSPNQLLWQGQAYKLNWNGERSIDTTATFRDVLVPQADYGIYLVNAVKFYVGQLFHLFDEAAFMDNFTKFYDPTADRPTTTSLWFSHYLLILAFGTAFVSRNSRDDNCPAGSAFFLQAMNTLPDLSFANPESLDSLEAIEILCCAALYLQSLDFRAAAYRQIGQALRFALEQGLHTDMEHQSALDSALERPRRIWWTVLLLDRQMSSLMGVPLALRDEDIDARLPSFGSSVSKVRALELHVRMSSILAVIVTSAYI